MPPPLIRVYGLPDCARCAAAKDKLNRMGLSFTYHTLTDFTKPHDGWRTDGSAAILAAATFYDNHAPIIFIDDAPFDYPGAMRRLRK